MFDLEAVGEASMAAGPVGIAGGVFGGRALFVVGSIRLTVAFDDVDDATGLRNSCLFVTTLLSTTPAAIDSQLSLRRGPVAGPAGAADIKLEAPRIGRVCTSELDRESSI